MRYTKKQRKQIKRRISKKYIKKSRRSRRSRMGRRMRKMQKGGAMVELGHSDFPGDYDGQKLSYNETGASSGYGIQIPSSDAQLNSALSSPTPISSYAKM